MRSIHSSAHSQVWGESKGYAGICIVTESLRLTSGVMGLLTGPHQTSFSEDSSFTTRLSEGERPVLAPE